VLRVYAAFSGKQPILVSGGPHTIQNENMDLVRLLGMFGRVGLLSVKPALGQYLVLVLSAANQGPEKN
jgi:hypothetical protein